MFFIVSTSVWVGEDTNVFLSLIQGKNVTAALDSLCQNPPLLALNDLLILLLLFLIEHFKVEIPSAIYGNAQNVFIL